MMQNSAGSNELFCKQKNGDERIFNLYRGFRPAAVKLLVEYLFSGHLLKIEQNQRELRFDIYLCKLHKDTLREVDMREIDKFRKYYGRGFNVIVWTQSDIECAD